MASKKKTTASKKSAPWDHPAPNSAHHTGLTPQQKQHAKARAKKAGRSYPNMVDNMHEAAEAHAGTRKKATKRKGAAKSAGSRKKSGATKRTPNKKASSKRAPTKKSAAKKSAAKKTTSKRAPAKKTSSKRAPIKKRAAKKTTTTKRAPAKRRSAAARAAGKAAPTRDPKGGLTAAGRRAFHERDGANLKPGVTKKQGEMSAEDMKRKGSWATRFYGRSGKLPPLQDASGKPTRLALTAAAWGEPVPKTWDQARKIAAKGRRLLEKARALSQ